MSTTDIILLIILMVGFYFGYKKGFLYQISSFLSLVLAYFFTGKLFMYLHHFLIEEGYLTEASSKWVSYGLCFVGIIILIRLLTRLIVSFLKTLGINFVNKFAGGILGSAKWAVIISLLVYAVYDLEIFQIESLKKSEFLPYFETIGEKLVNYVS